MLATNVAETSLTVPGIRYVIDPGTARISRYSLRTKVQRLPIEAISQASANQRKGRCGRVADGICIRLYSQEDFETRPEFTDPEIQRTNLASVILQMAAARLGDVREFPFVDPPDPRAITDGVKLLEELNAVAERPAHRDRPPDGPAARRPAHRPDDHRVGQAGLRPGDPGHRRRAVHPGPARAPVGQPAGRRHRAPPLRPAGVGLPRLRRAVGLPRRAAARAVRLRVPPPVPRRVPQLPARPRVAGPARPAVLAHPRPRHQHQDIVIRTSACTHRPARRPALPGRHEGGARPGQAAGAGRPGAAAPAERGRRPLPEYLGARGTKFAVFPGSGLARKPPDWVVAAELVETSRLWARTVAAIEPEWVEPVAAHLVKRSYSEPRWSRSQGSAVATEKVTLYGIPIVADRTVLLHRIDPVLARELFIRHALVEGDWQTRHHFFRDNAAADRAGGRARAAGPPPRPGRGGGGAVTRSTTPGCPPTRSPPATSTPGGRRPAARDARTCSPSRLDDLLSAEADELDAGDYPEVWTSASGRDSAAAVAGAGLSLSYAFEPGSDADGVTIDIPLKTLNQARPEEFSWQVPGLRLELVTELIRSLPKTLRRELVPAPNVAREILAKLDGDGRPDGDIRDVMSRELLRLRGVRVPPDDFDLDKLPPHLRFTFRVLDGDQGRRRGQGPGRAAAPAAAQGPRHPVRPRHRADQDRGHHLGLRPAAQGVHRRRGQGLPRPRRRGRPW